MYKPTQCTLYLQLYKTHTHFSIIPLTQCFFAFQVALIIFSFEVSIIKKLTILVENLHFAVHLMI